jgi:hypothetical protein
MIPDELDRYLDDFGRQLAAATAAPSGGRTLRVWRRRADRRWILGLAVASVVLAGGVAAAATGLFHIAGGRASRGTYVIDRVPAGSGPPGSGCLELRFDGRAPAYGCGRPPSPAKPFGVVIADSVGRPADRVIYGLVLADVARVAVVGDGGRQTHVTTVGKAGLPGRFFVVVVPGHGRIELVGYDATGQPRARIGSRARPAGKPASHDEAVAQGDPAGFAPAMALPSSFTYDGRQISPADAAARGLACAQDADGVRCR